MFGITPLALALLLMLSLGSVAAHDTVTVALGLLSVWMTEMSLEKSSIVSKSKIRRWAISVYAVKSLWQ